MGMMYEFKVLDPNGHTRTAWDPDNADEVAHARRMYEDLTGRGYRAFRVGKGAGEGTPTGGFDPKEEETLFVPPIHAG